MRVNTMEMVRMFTDIFQKRAVCQWRAQAQAGRRESEKSARGRADPRAAPGAPLGGEGGPGAVEPSVEGGRPAGRSAPRPLCDTPLWSLVMVTAKRAHTFSITPRRLPHRRPLAQRKNLWF